MKVLGRHITDNGGSHVCAKHATLNNKNPTVLNIIESYFFVSDCS